MSRIASELERFLQRSRVGLVRIAEGRLPPPPLGFVVRFPRLSLTLRGADEMEIERHGRHEVVNSRRGEVVLVPPHAWNRPTWRRPVQVLHFLFGPLHIGASLVNHDGKSAEPRGVLKTRLPAAEGSLRHMVNAFVGLPTAEAALNRVAPPLITALLHALLPVLQAEPQPPERKGRHTYDSICLYLQENFHRELTRDSVAAQFRLHPSHLSRVFRTEGLMRFTDYLAWVRVDRAKYLLKQHDMALDELASSCGFNDTAYFCRVFKQRTQKTPGCYRQEARAAGTSAG